MRTHDHDHDGPEVPRPKTARPHAPDAAMAARAAVAGRWDAVSASGILALQRAAGNRGVAAALQDQDRTVVREVAGSGGRPPLQAGGRADMQARLGHDVGDLWVHHDTRAEEPATAVNAHACTAGLDIVFQRDRDDPASGEGRVGLAHELAPAGQQRPAVGAASPSRITPAGDPDELEAGRVAGDAAGGGLAQPVAASAQAPLIQRKAFIGVDQDPRSVGVKRAEFGVPRNISPGATDPTVEYQHAELGTGERNVGTIVKDQKSRYFRNRKELYDYAEGKTEDIGYVDREKTWVRLPKEFLVLGESHGETTLLDLIEATGTKRYIYEGGPMRPSPYLHPGEPAEGLPWEKAPPGKKGQPGTPGPLPTDTSAPLPTHASTAPTPASPSEDRPGPGHALEETLPKFLIGLIGVQTRLRQKLADLSRSRGWKARIRKAAKAAEPVDPEAGKKKYKQELAEWSSEWEAKHQTPETRKSTIHASPKFGRYNDELQPKPPPKDYTRERAEDVVARMALEELRGAAFGEDERITDFYLKNQWVIEMTIAQLSRGVPVDLTEMFLMMATGKFNLSGLIRLLSAAAEREFSASPARDVSIEEGYGGKCAKYGGKFGKYGGMYDKAPDRTKPAEDQMRWDELRMERLRDSYMFHKILEAKKAGYRLAGLGDAHRENLEGLLKNDPEILVKQSPAFYLAQYRDHPDRD